MTKTSCLNEAIEITKAFAGGSKSGDVDNVLEEVYKKLVELSKDAEDRTSFQ